MGTDIHLAAEVKNDEGKWEAVPGPIVDCWSCDGTGIVWRWDITSTGKRKVSVLNDDGTPKVCTWCTNDGTKPEYEGDDGAYYRERYVQPGKTRDHWYSDRNYTVFAILGNVRNGRGFAGIYSHDPIPFISDNRGVPEDATPETLAILSNEHSETWCTLLEVMEYDWHAPIHRGGVIGLDEYEKLRTLRARPESWSGGISGGGIITVSMAEADSILAGGLKLRADRVYVNYEWDDTLDEYTAQFRERMKMLAMEVGERECRLIYDFDS